jgi:hypothetical protein
VNTIPVAQQSDTSMVSFTSGPAKDDIECVLLPPQDIASMLGLRLGAYTVEYLWQGQTRITFVLRAGKELAGYVWYYLEGDARAR